MSVLTVTNLPDEVLAELQRRAAAHGVSVEDEVRRVLEDAVPIARGDAAKELFLSKEHLTDAPDDVPDWIFDRHDLRYGQPLLPPSEDFKAHLLALGEVGADIRLDWPRTPSEHRTIDL